MDAPLIGYRQEEGQGSFLFAMNKTSAENFNQKNNLLKGYWGKTVPRTNSHIC